jgi:hypothetical protein
MCAYPNRQLMRRAAAHGGEGSRAAARRGLPKQSPTQAPHESSLSSGRAWARNRISSTITEHMVMALRHDRARFGCERLGPRPSV